MYLNLKEPTLKMSSVKIYECKTKNYTQNKRLYYIVIIYEYLYLNVIE